MGKDTDKLKIKVPTGTIVKIMGHPVKLKRALWVRGCDINDETQFEVMDYEPATKKPTGGG